MSSYFKQANPAELLKAYPLGEAFLTGPASLNKTDLSELQHRRFQRIIKRAWQIPFYQRLWKNAGLQPVDIHGLEDLVHVPVFTKHDLMSSVTNVPPFGDYHGFHEKGESGVRTVFHTTSGTTGEPQPLYFGPRDREIQNILLARAYLLQGLRPCDVVHSVYGFGMVNGGHYIREAILHYTDSLLLPAGTGAETRSVQQVELMKRFGATVLVGFSDFLYKLAEVARDNGLEPGDDIPIRMISGHLDRASRGNLGNAWAGAETYDWYGVGDTGIIASEGPDRDGLHIWEDAHIVEILDPFSDQPVSEGMLGNICVTTLFKDTVYPIIRFNTQDVSSFLKPDPNSGINFKRLSGFGGRSDNMVKLRGVNVYPTAIGSMLRNLEGVTGEYVCRINASATEMTVLIEHKSNSDADRDKISEFLRNQLGVQIEVKLVDTGTTSVLTGLEQRQKPKRLIHDPN